MSYTINWATTSDGTRNFGSTSGNIFCAQSFTTVATGTSTSIDVFLQKFGTPVDNILIAIQANSSGVPSGVNLSSQEALSGSTLTTSAVKYTITFATPATLAATTLFHCVFHRSGAADGSNFYRFSNLSTGGTSSSYFEQSDGVTWPGITTDQAEGDINIGTVTVSSPPSLSLLGVGT